MPDFELLLPDLITATIFVVASVVIFWMAWRKSCRTLKRMSDHAVDPLPTTNVTIIAAILTLGAAATGLLLWLI